MTERDNSEEHKIYRPVLADHLISRPLDFSGNKPISTLAVFVVEHRTIQPKDGYGLIPVNFVEETGFIQDLEDCLYGIGEYRKLKAHRGVRLRVGEVGRALEAPEEMVARLSGSIREESTGGFCFEIANTEDITRQFVEGINRVSRFRPNPRGSILPE